MAAKVEIDGYVGKDPELKTATSGTKYATYSIASYRKNPADANKPLTDWFNITAFGDQADLVAANIKKGSKVCAKCTIQTKEKDGKTFTSYIQDRFYIEPRAEKKSEVHESGSIHDDLELPF